MNSSRECLQASLALWVGLVLWPGTSIISTSSSDAQVLRDEVEALSRLDHDNICRLYTLEGTGNDCGLVMEYANGKCLSERLGSRKLPLGTVVNYALQIANALEEAHRHPECIVHRDLKPDNIIQTSGDRLKVLDFGIAAIQGLHRSTRPAGTSAYLSPERWDDLSHATTQDDIWAFGVMLYEMLYQERPYPPRSHGVARPDFGKTPRGIRNPPPEVPHDLLELLKGSLHLNPSARIRDGYELRVRLQKIRNLMSKLEFERAK